MIDFKLRFYRSIKYLHIGAFSKEPQIGCDKKPQVPDPWAKDP